MHALKGGQPQRQRKLAAILQENQWPQVIVPYRQQIQDRHQDKLRPENRHENPGIDLERIGPVNPRRFLIILRNPHQKLPHQENIISRAKP